MSNEASCTYQCCRTEEACIAGECVPAAATADAAPPDLDADADPPTEITPDAPVAGLPDAM